MDSWSTPPARNSTRSSSGAMLTPAQQTMSSGLEAVESARSLAHQRQLVVVRKR